MRALPRYLQVTPMQALVSQTTKMPRVLNSSTVNTFDGLGRTLLSTSVELRVHDAVHAVLPYATYETLNRHDAFGRTPLTMLMNDRADDTALAITKALITAGADPRIGDASGTTIMHASYREDGNPLFRFTADQLEDLARLVGDENARRLANLEDGSGVSPILHHALFAENLDAMGVLTQMGARLYLPCQRTEALIERASTEAQKILRDIC